MANLTQTAANVKPLDGSKTARGIAGESITQGMPIYLASDGKLYKCDADAAGKDACDGISFSPATSGGVVHYVTSGPMDVGATLTVGQTYSVSDTAGAICPESDLGSGDKVTNLGIATAAGVLDVQIHRSGATHA